MKHNKLLPFVAGIFVLLMNTGTIHAQERKLSLSQAVELSLRNSKTLRLNQAKIAESAASLREARDHRLPDLKISGGYLRVNDPNVDLKTKDNNNGGGGNGSGSGMPSVSQAAYGMANLSLPLFTGGRIKYGIEAATCLERAARLDAESRKEEVVMNAVDAFTNFYKAGATVGLIKESLEQSRQRVTDFTNLERNGLLARNDLLKAQLQSSNIELSLLDAESSLKLANVAMNLMLGFPEQTLLIPDSAGFELPDNLEALNYYEQLSLTHRKDREALSLRRKAAGSDIKSARADLLPSIALTGGYVALEVPKLLTVTNAVNLGLGVQYSLSSLWKNKARVEQAKARELALEVNEKQLDDAVILAVNQAYQRYLVSRKKMEVYKQAITQAEENYRITRNKYENSLVNTTELLDAELDQLQARLNYAFSRVDAVVAYDKLLSEAGLLAESKK